MMSATYEVCRSARVFYLYGGFSFSLLPCFTVCSRRSGSVRNFLSHTPQTKNDTLLDLAVVMNKKPLARINTAATMFANQLYENGASRATKNKLPEINNKTPVSKITRSMRKHGNITI